MARSAISATVSTLRRPSGSRSCSCSGVRNCARARSNTPKRDKPAELDAPRIAGERCAHRLLQLLRVRFGAHRHEINGDDAAQIAQPDLARGFMRGGDVEIERKAFRIAAALRGRLHRHRWRRARLSARS